MGQGLKQQGLRDIGDAPPSCEEAYASLYRLAAALRDYKLVRDIANSINGRAFETLMPSDQGPVVIRFTGPYGVLQRSDLGDTSANAVYRLCCNLSGMPPVVVCLANSGQLPYVVRSSKFQD